MPIYEYTCLKCHECFSVLQSITASSGDVTCPKCGSHDVVKKISACALGGGSSSGSFGGG